MGISIKIITKIPKTDNRKHSCLINDQWVLLKEPKNVLTAIMASIPFMAINALITISIIKTFTTIPFLDTGLILNNLSITINLIDILGILLILIIHEFTHLIFIPDFYRSDKTYAGITYAGGYVYTEEVLTRKRYLIISIAPFFILSIILPIILGITGTLSPLMIFLILLNSIGSSVDILSMVLVFLQVPAGSHLVCSGNNTYWKSNS
ncbi:hypothetical protein CUJ83_08600 [Methanocella sp. CWC-04]|uniref:Zincin peptidase n=1 Tax=Methanooceanicella nereidis TaxID=2052831 RepID=A0AAP2REG4_9EURY|nr:DUF3267 domain-containing protein [Methanocella sp. CWC-04]MCD1295055.1 hypothetical protein [Methanocella sp. CWC-04]